MNCPRNLHEQLIFTKDGSDRDQFESIILYSLAEVRKTTKNLRISYVTSGIGTVYSSYESPQFIAY